MLTPSVGALLPACRETPLTLRRCVNTTRMLEKDPAQRLSMAAALAHPWISAGASAAPSTLLSSVVVARLQSFTRTSRLERLLLNLAANQLTSKEIDRLGAMFRALDHDDDGCAFYLVGFLQNPQS